MCHIIIKDEADDFTLTSFVFGKAITAASIYVRTLHASWDEAGARDRVWLASAPIVDMHQSLAKAWRARGVSISAPSKSHIVDARLRTIRDPLAAWKDARGCVRGVEHARDQVP